jgi:hypothetical protein
MASIINAATSGGLITTADTSGILQLQTAGTTAVTVDASQNVTFVNSASLPNTFGFKNRLINGAMVIDQRNAGASVTPTSSSYLLDRWRLSITDASKLSVQQSTDAPAGFTNSTIMTSLSSFSIITSSAFRYRQFIEGYNVADLAWGTASAKTVTLSFWVKSSLTGNFGGSLGNNGGTRSYPFSYTISVANTWEQKSITIAGDTSGTWLTTNGVGVSVTFGLGVGSTLSGPADVWAGANYESVTGAVSVVGTSGATFYITGVQLEKGTQATSFDWRSYGTELNLCQRYCQNIRAADGNGSYLRYGYGEYASTTNLSLNINLFATMRITPALTTTTAALYGGFSSGTISAASALNIGADGSSPSVANVQMTSSGLTAGRAAALLSNNNQTSFLLLTAEL